MRGIWDQNQDKQPVRVTTATPSFGKSCTDFIYGLEFLRDFEPPTGRADKIGLNEWIRSAFDGAGSIDEDGCYADAEFKTLKRRAVAWRACDGRVRGAHSDLVTYRSRRQDRRDPPSWKPGTDPAASADVVFVQFPGGLHP